MKILGIETSCDETSASVVSNGVVVLSNQTLTSLKEHARYGGIIPEIASRRQIELIYPIVEEALAKANVTLNEINAIAVTTSPGLLGSLLVGISFAKSLARSINKPLIPVNHVHAHLYANFLRMPDEKDKILPKLPAIGLVVSGGHTSLYLIRNFKKFNLLGSTRDDAAGEAFDKVARILNLPYPGGPSIDRLAATAGETQLTFPRASFKDSFDFSFSGVKTSVLYHVQKYSKDKNFSIPEIARAFQQSVVDVLVERSINACQHYRINTLVVGGGVAANSMLRQRLFNRAASLGIYVFVPSMPLCLDNAAMIAGIGSVLTQRQR